MIVKPFFENKPYSVIFDDTPDMQLVDDSTQAFIKLTPELSTKFD